MSDEITEGFGDEEISRSDLATFRRALRQDWPIPPNVKQMLIERMVDLVDPVAVDPKTGKARKKSVPHRTVIAAAKVLAVYGNLSVKQQALDLGRDRLELGADNAPTGLPTAQDVVRDMQAAAERYEHEHPDEPPPGDRPGDGEVPGEAGEVQ